MEVLRHGKLYRIAVCTECGCEFRFHTDEMRTETAPEKISNRSYNYNYIDCPECKNSIMLEKQEVEI